MSEVVTKTLVVMPVWNAEKFLAEAVDSILIQKGCDFRLLVVDDGSTDRSLEILEGYRDERLILCPRPHEGLCRAMNFAIRYAHDHGYSYMVRMDADDISLPGRLAALVHCVSSTGAIAASSNCIYINLQGKRTGTSTVAVRPGWVKWEIRHGMRGLVQGAAIFNVATLVAVGGYREKFRLAEDADLFLRLIEHGEVTNIKKTYYLIRQNPGSRSLMGFLDNVLYSNYARNCAMRRRKGKFELEYSDFVAQSKLSLLPAYTEYASVCLWLWCGGAFWRKLFLPISALLSPLRIVARVARRWV